VLFFEQRTAYEICADWSSVVSSSDLPCDEAERSRRRYRRHSRQTADVGEGQIEIRFRTGHDAARFRKEISRNHEAAKIRHHFHRSEERRVGKEHTAWRSIDGEEQQPV